MDRRFLAASSDPGPALPRSTSIEGPKLTIMAKADMEKEKKDKKESEKGEMEEGRCPLRWLVEAQVIGTEVAAAESVGGRDTGMAELGVASIARMPHPPIRPPQRNGKMKPRLGPLVVPTKGSKKKHPADGNATPDAVWARD